MSSVTIAERHYSAFALRARQLIRIGFDDARPSISSSTAEEVVTDLIVRAIRARHKSGDIDRPLQRMSVRDDVKVESDVRFGKQRKRIDIEVESHGHSRPVFSVEAKCLRQSSHTIGLYTGDEGMMCFVNGDYANDEPEAAMLGYLQTNDDVYWLAELERKLTENKVELGLSEDLKPSPTPSFSCEHISSHVRKSGTVIQIHHILVDCC